MELPDTIPTDVVDLMALIRRTPAGSRHQIALRLEEQLGDQSRAHRLFEEAEADVLHDELCERLRAELRAALSGVQAGLERAENLVTMLRSDQVYDVEYDSDKGADLLHVVAEMRRGARLAVLVEASIA